MCQLVRGASDQKKDKMHYFFIEIIMNIDGSVLDKGFIVGTFLEFQ